MADCRIKRLNEFSLDFPLTLYFSADAKSNWMGLPSLSSKKKIRGGLSQGLGDAILFSTFRLLGFQPTLSMFVWVLKNNKEKNTWWWEYAQVYMYMTNNIFEFKEIVQTDCLN